MTHAELRRDPRWKKRRCEMIEKAQRTCVECREPKSYLELEVHHTTYARGLMPWEYPDDTLLCLCRQCHEERQINEDEARFEFGRVLGHLSKIEVYELTKKLRFFANTASEHGADDPWGPSKFFDGSRALFQEMRRRFRT